MRIIINGPPEHASWALQALLEHQSDFANCPVGCGWGFRKPDAKMFGRRTKTGLSAVVEATPTQRQEP